MPRSKRSVIWGGKEVELAGRGLRVGARAPEFTGVLGDFSPFSSASFAGTVTVINSVPSLDTGVCARQTKRFDAEVAALGGHVRILVVSMDLPFAQRRFCQAESVEGVVTLSDHRDASFGTAYGLLIADLRLLARSVTVLDRKGVVRYQQVVRETGTEPDYDAALEVVRQLI
jgi:thioredoxin-dependent peroxiredoxin